MKESVLHFIWQYKLFNTRNETLKTTDGEIVEVIDVGKYNTDAGPDFFNAKIKIGHTVWAGNVEFHQLSSDWEKHQHLNNKAYDNVILHIVEKADRDVYRTNGEKIPQMELSGSEETQAKYSELLTNRTWIACENTIGSVDAFRIQDWKNALLHERFEIKTQTISSLLINTDNHWEEAFYISLARSFGFGVNSLPFELMAKSLPLQIIGKHKDDLLQLEALLLGQAGLLNDEVDDDYALRLKKEYHFLQTKYHLVQIDKSQWKLLRLRPDNFPYIRLAQFATLIFTSSKLFSKILENKDISSLRALFHCEVSEYWKNHYLFGKKSDKPSSKKMGNSTIDILLINTVVPFLFAYGKQKADQDLVDRAFAFLEEIPSEKNTIIDKWKTLGVNSINAFDSQALLHLKKNYCDEKKCLRCRIGHQIIVAK